MTGTITISEHVSNSDKESKVYPISLHAIQITASQTARKLLHFLWHPTSCIHNSSEVYCKLVWWTEDVTEASSVLPSIFGEFREWSETFE